MRVGTSSAEWIPRYVCRERALPALPLASIITPIPAFSQQVAIVGLGPVGALLANLLGARGVRVTVYERDAGPRNEPRAAHLDDDALRILQAAGVADAITASGRTIDGMEIVDRRGRRLIRARKRQDENSPNGWPAATLVHQPDVEAQLRARLTRYPNVEVRWGHVVENIEPTETGLVLHVRADDASYSDRAAWVVGCDGARSTVRAAMGATMHPVDRPFSERWLVVDTTLRRPVELPLELTQYADASRPATYVPFAGARRRWEFRLRAGEDADAMSTPESVAGLLGHHVDASALEIERAAVYTFSSAVAQPWRRGRMLIAGDAAHLMPPFIGQGLCSGLRDAAFLGWALPAVVQSGASDALLDAYERERRPHAAVAIRFSVRAGRFIGAGRFLSSIRDGLFAAVRRLEPLTRRLDDIGAGAPDIPAVVAGSNGQPLRLVPQPWVESGSGQRIRLDDALGSSWAVIGVGLDPSTWAGDDEIWTRLDARIVRVSGATEAGTSVELRDTDDVIARWAGASTAHPRVLVVRPDRHLFGLYGEADRQRARNDLKRALGLEPADG